MLSIPAAPAQRAPRLDSIADELERALAEWKAPKLPDETVEALATVFLMQRRHALMPFFVWLDQRAPWTRQP